MGGNGSKRIEKVRNGSRIHRNGPDDPSEK